jgi:hypothetical protein
MEDGLGLQANFVPNPYASVAGAHYGVLTTGSGLQSGLMRLTVSESGLFTGQVRISGTTLGFSGQLDTDGAAAVTIAGSGANPLTITLQADLTGGTGDVTGSFADGAETFAFAASQSTYNATTNAAPQAGRYTLVLAPNQATTGADVPQGNGYATVVVSANGAVTVAGRLADGTPYSATGRVANDGTLALYCVPSGAPAGSSLNGLLTFRSTDVSDVDGSFTWTKTPNAAEAYYPGGFSTELPSVGSRYVRPAAGLLSAEAFSGPATAGFGGGNIAQPLDVPIITQGNKATMVTPGLPDVTLTINPVSGAVSGTFLLPDGNLTRGVHGVIFQKQQSAFGYFRGVDQCGYFSMMK